MPSQWKNRLLQRIAEWLETREQWINRSFDRVLVNGQCEYHPRHPAQAAMAPWWIAVPFNALAVVVTPLWFALVWSFTVSLRVIRVLAKRTVRRLDLRHLLAIFVLLWLLFEGWVQRLFPPMPTWWELILELFGA